MFISYTNIFLRGRAIAMGTRFMSSTPTIVVSPSVSKLDQPLNIEIGSVLPTKKFKVELITGRKGVIMESHAYFFSDDTGRINLSKDATVKPSSYSGIDSMGLFGSLDMSPRSSSKIAFRYLSGEVNHFDFTVNLYDETQNLIASKDFLRYCYSDNDVKRIPVRFKRFRGTLFLPKGPGPHPALLDIFGGATGLVEYRASMFASHGFATLAVAYGNYEDLPTTLDKMDLEYFEEGLDYLRTIPSIDANNIGTYGSCLGGALALSIARYVPGVKASAAVSPFIHAAWGWDWVYRDIRIPQMKLPNVKPRMKDGGVVLKDYQDPNIDHYEGHLFDMESFKGSLLMFFATEDYCFNVPIILELLKRQLSHHHDAQWFLYQDAGHIIQPPYVPLFKKYYTTIYKNFLYYGGYPEAHSKAQVDSWRRTIEFFKRRLTSNYVGEFTSDSPKNSTVIAKL